jgi:hypothetical protein
MWSRKFVAAGLSSATVFAALSAFAIWLLFYLVLSPAVNAGHMEATGIFEFVFSVAVGVFVYPACWFFMVQRARDYGPKHTLELICVTYGISCLAVAVVFCLAMATAFGAVVFMGFLKMIFGSIEANWQSLGYGVLVVAATPLVALFGIGMGALIVLPAFIVIAAPIAYLHRWLLLKMFAPNGTNMLQTNAGS